MPLGVVYTWKLTLCLYHTSCENYMVSVKWTAIKAPIIQNQNGNIRSKYVKSNKLKVIELNFDRIMRISQLSIKKSTEI